MYIKPKYKCILKNLVKDKDSNIKILFNELIEVSADTIKTISLYSSNGPGIEINDVNNVLADLYIMINMFDIVTDKTNSSIKPIQHFITTRLKAIESIYNEEIELSKNEE